MHRCLEILDVVAMILDNFIEPRVESPSIRRSWPFKGSSDLVNLAVTCRTFSEPALDRLWFFAPNLVNLVMTIPGAMQHNISDDLHHGCFVMLPKELQPKDLGRFRYYSKKIRVLGEFYSTQDISGGDGEALEWAPHLHHLVLPILLSMNQTNVLPNIQLYNAQLSEFADHAWPLRAVMSEGVPALTVTVHEYQIARNEVPALLARINDIIEPVSGTLKDLTLSLEMAVRGNRGPLLSVQEDLSPGFIPVFNQRLQRIERLSMLNMEIDTAGLLHVVALPTLRVLAVTLSSREIQGFINAPPKVACELREVTIRTESLQLCAKLLAILGQPSLRFLRLIRRRIPSAEKWDVINFLAPLLRNEFMAHVTGIQIEAPTPSSHTEDVSTDITAETIRPLLSLQYLEILKLSLSSRVLLNPTNLMQMAQAWPSLRILDLNESTRGTLPSITLCDAARFVALCPKLTDLHLRVNASNFNFQEASSIPPSKNLLNLDICTSPISSRSNELAGIIQFLAFVFPNLSTLGFGWKRVGTDPWLPAPNQDAEQRHLERWSLIQFELGAALPSFQAL